MSRVAVFVDAGYLFAQGSAAIAGEKQPRRKLHLNETAVLAELTKLAHEKSDGARLLRTYWYDAAVGARMLTQHATLAETDYVKLRLGVLNSHGEQKGVDSLIVTDLIELSRNGAICDAVLLSGDEDVRVGVQMAQNFGVGVHLIGITPARGSQAHLLRQEADSNTEWDRDVVARFLTVLADEAALEPAKPSVAPAAEPAPSAPVALSDEDAAKSQAALQATVGSFVAGLDSSALIALEKFWDAGERGLPSDMDRPVIGRCRDALARNLSRAELSSARIMFRNKVEARLKKGHHR